MLRQNGDPRQLVDHLPEHNVIHLRAGMRPEQTVLHLLGIVSKAFAVMLQDPLIELPKQSSPCLKRPKVRVRQPVRDQPADTLVRCYQRNRSRRVTPRNGNGGRNSRRRGAMNNHVKVWFLTRRSGIVSVCGKGSQGKSSGGRSNNCSDIHCALPP